MAHFEHLFRFLMPSRMVALRFLHAPLLEFSGALSKLHLIEFVPLAHHVMLDDVDRMYQFLSFSLRML